jgi:hypothetical protein
VASSSYSSKQLRTTLILPEANFPGTSSNTLTLTGFRASATITGAANFPSSMDLAIYGMSQADMNALTVLWANPIATAVPAVPLVQLEASSDGVTWTQVFEGTFFEASPDYRGIPDACLRISAMTGYRSVIEPAPPTSYTGSASVVQIAQYLAGKMGFTLENNGVSGTLSTPYFPGTYMDQFRELCEHANLDYYFDGNTVLAICPKNQPRQGKPVPVLSPSSGLIGFPTVERYGLHVDALFTPALALGGQLQIADSIVPSANGSWFSYFLEYRLESVMPDGLWQVGMKCSKAPISTP